MKLLGSDDLISKLRELRVLSEECLAIATTSLGDESHLKTATHAQDQVDVDFDKPLRPFVKFYSKGLGGSKKFVLVLAWLAKGNPQNQIALSEIKKRWRQMKSLLGIDFNLFFTGDAKDRDWVETKSKGVYNLRPTWRDALRRN